MPPGEIPKYKKYICAFGDNRMKRSIQRFHDQAVNMQFYDGIFMYTEKELEDEFVTHFSSKFHLRGFGYWCWKPQVILQTLQKMDDGDILQYSDVGCHLNPRGLTLLHEYYTLTDKAEKGILGFHQLEYPEKHWTKGDIFDYFNVRHDENIYNSGQFLGGVIFVKKCKPAIEIIKSYSEIFYSHFELVDDSPSRSDNFPGFIENRHDQSIWSLLLKKNGINTLYYKEINYTSFEFENYPVLALRDCDFGFMWRFKKYIKAILKAMLPKIVIEKLRKKRS